MINNDVPFSGRIIFADKNSYKNFIGYRQHINTLKHHAGSNKVTHYIKHDSNQFEIKTVFPTTDIKGHIFSDKLEIKTSNDKTNIDNALKCHASLVKSCKAEIDGYIRLFKKSLKKEEPLSKEEDKPQGLWKKFLKLFKKT